MTTMTISEQKTAARKEVKRRLRALDPYYIRWSDKAILENLTALEDYLRASVLFCFVGMKDEIDTLPLIRDAWTRGKTVGVPVCLDDAHMLLREICSEEDLTVGMYGIREPKETCPVIPASEIGFSLIPCLSCDASGNRLGKGKGYYDRFLKDVASTRCMVCRTRLMLDRVPVDELDIRPDMLVTESAVLRFSRP